MPLQTRLLALLNPHSNLLLQSFRYLRFVILGHCLSIHPLSLDSTLIFLFLLLLHKDAQFVLFLGNLMSLALVQFLGEEFVLLCHLHDLALSFGGVVTRAQFHLTKIQPRLSLKHLLPHLSLLFLPLDKIHLHPLEPRNCKWLRASSLAV